MNVNRSGSFNSTTTSRSLSSVSSSEKLHDIGAHFGISESGVSQAGRWIRGKIQKDKKLKRKIEKLEKKVSN